MSETGVVNIHGIPSQPGYFITEDGRIFKEKKATIGKNGYPHTGFRRGDKNRYIHDLVLETFVGPRPDGHQASHLNGDRADSRLENLTWETPKENNARKSGHGTEPVGENRYNAVVDPADVYYIRSLKNTGYGFFTALAKKLGYDVNTVRSIYYKQTWKHL